MPLDTAERVPAPSRAAKSRSKRRQHRAERELARAQDLEDELLLALAEDRLGERDQRRRRRRARAAACRAASACSSESTSACHDAAMTFSCTPIEPHDVLAVGGVEQHAGDRAGALRLVEDAHLEVHELDVAQVRVDLGDRRRAARASSALTGPLPSAVRT